VGEVDYRIEINNGKAKTYHINMLKRYFRRDELKPDKASNESNVNKPDQVHQRVSVACVLEDEEAVEELAVNDAAILPLYNLKPKETVAEVVVNEELDEVKKTEVKKLLEE